MSFAAQVLGGYEDIHRCNGPSIESLCDIVRRRHISPVDEILYCMNGSRAYRVASVIQ